MANIIFLVIFIIGLVYSLFTGRVDNVINVMLEAPKNAFTIFFQIYVQLVFWSGLLGICKDSGLLKKISTCLSFVIHPLFKRIDKNDDALSYISLNFVANMLSLGSAATPFGLLAMKRLQELNDNKDVASDEMITFVLINTSGLCIIPTTILALRISSGSINPMIVIPYILIISSVCTFMAIIIDIEARKYVKL